MWAPRNKFLSIPQKKHLGQRGGQNVTGTGSQQCTLVHRGKEKKIYCILSTRRPPRKQTGENPEWILSFIG